jgi:hypothetical protein
VIGTKGEIVLMVSPRQFVCSQEFDGFKVVKTVFHLERKIMPANLANHFTVARGVKTSQICLGLFLYF